MAKCSICTSRVETTFLNKLVGSYIKDSKGKMHLICNQCQSKLRSKEILLKTMKK